MGKTFRRNSNFGAFRTREGTEARVLEHMATSRRFVHREDVSVYESKKDFRARKPEIEKQYREAIEVWHKRHIEVDAARKVYAEKRLWPVYHWPEHLAYPTKPNRWEFFRRKIVGSKPFDVDAYFDECVEDWFEGETVRDGKGGWKHGGNRDYRDMTNTMIRQSNRANAKKVLRESEEDIIWMTNADAKKFIWDVW